MISADFSTTTQFRLRWLGQPSYDLLLEQSLTNFVHDAGVQKCTLQVRNYTQNCVHKVLLVIHHHQHSSKRLFNLSWEFEESEEDPVTSIPYQLQRLFVLLQTSKKRAIETTDVTRSFGWDSSEGEHLSSCVTRLTWLVCVFLSMCLCICTLITFFLCACLFLAWQQHDIQELCRVMFDALEQKWKQTEQVGESKTFS